MDTQEYAVVLLYNKKKEFLLQKRSKNQTSPGKWGTFGGHMDDSENVDGALIREIKEELDFDLRGYELIDTYNDTEGRVFNLHIGPFSRSVNDVILHEGDDFGFFSPDYALEHLELTHTTKKNVEICKKHFGI